MRAYLGALLAAVALTALSGCEEPHLPSGAATEPAVSVALPIVQNVTDYAYFTGRTDAEKSVDVRARVSGYLTRINFRPGSEVKEGDSLFEIDPRPYQAELDHAQGSLERSEALVARLTKDQERALKLPAGTITPQELDKIASDLAEAKASVTVARADVDSAKLDLEFTNITAPFGGRIGRNLVSEGQLITANNPLGEPLTTIVTVDPMFAYFDCDENRMLEIQKRIREGKMASARETPGKVRIDMGLGNEGTAFPHTGTLDFVNNRVNPSTGTLQVRGVFPNPLVTGDSRMLSPGLFVRARLPMGEPHDAVMIKGEAVVADQGQKVVYVLNEKDEVEARHVTLGEQHDGLVEILSGLLPSDRVVVSNLQRLRPDVNMKVTPTLVEMQGGGPTAPPAVQVAPEPAGAKSEGGKH